MYKHNVTRASFLLGSPMLAGSILLADCLEDFATALTDNGTH